MSLPYQRPEITPACFCRAGEAGTGAGPPAEFCLLRSRTGGAHLAWAPRRTSTQPCGTGFYAITGSSGTGSRAQPQRQNSARWSPRQRACISDARLPLTHELMPWMPRVGGYGKRTVVLFPIPLLIGMFIKDTRTAACCCCSRHRSFPFQSFTLRLHFAVTSTTQPRCCNHQFQWLTPRLIDFPDTQILSRNHHQ